MTKVNQENIESKIEQLQRELGKIEFDAEKIIQMTMDVEQETRDLDMGCGVVMDLVDSLREYYRKLCDFQHWMGELEKLI